MQQSGRRLVGGTGEDGSRGRPLTVPVHLRHGKGQRKADKKVPVGHEDNHKGLYPHCIMRSVCVCVCVSLWERERERNAVLKEPLNKMQLVTISLRTTNTLWSVCVLWHTPVAPLVWLVMCVLNVLKKTTLIHHYLMVPLICFFGLFCQIQVLPVLSPPGGAKMEAFGASLGLLTVPGCGNFHGSVITFTEQEMRWFLVPPQQWDRKGSSSQGPGTLLTHPGQALFWTEGAFGTRPEISVCLTHPAESSLRGQLWWRTFVEVNIMSLPT